MHGEALLITGLFGTGKSSVAVEIADILEKQGRPYAVIDLDWLCWGSAGGGEGSEHRMMLANLAPVVANYLDAGVRSFVLARSLRTREEVEGLRRILPMPLRVVGLVVPLDEIERRLGSDLTAGRADDLRDVATWVAAGEGSGFEDLSVMNDRPLRVVADEIVSFMGWEFGSGLTGDRMVTYARPRDRRRRPGVQSALRPHAAFPAGPAVRA